MSRSNISTQWEKNRSDIIAQFRSIQNQKLAKMFLIGSFALGEEDEDSDIDLAIITGPGFDIASANEVVKTMKKNCSLPLHIIFFPMFSEELLLSKGGILLCS